MTRSKKVIRAAENEVERLRQLVDKRLERSEDAQRKLEAARQRLAALKK